MNYTHKKEKQFLLITCILSFLQGLFYVYDGIITGFTINDFVLAALDFAYIPMILIWRKKGFAVFICLVSALLIWVNSRMETYLFNNFSALLCLFIAIMVFPKIKYFCMIGYLVATAIAFAFDNEPMYLYLIHTLRAIWLFVIYDIVIYENYSRKPVIFTEEEQNIIKQLYEGKYIKEIDYNCYSERTIRRRLKAAMKRNDVKTREELIELYKKHCIN